MFVFESDNLNSLYVELINSLAQKGKEIVKEGRKINELYPCVIKITNPKEGILVVKGRPYSPAFVIAEAVWNLAGDSDDWLCRYNPIYKKYFTDGKLKAGYGNRIFNWDNTTNQFELVVNRLKNEPHTEHANVIIFNPTYDLIKPKFVPCITRLGLDAPHSTRIGRLNEATALRKFILRWKKAKEINKLPFREL